MTALTEAARQLHARIHQLSAEHGSLRAAASALGLDVGYLSRLASGEKTEPSDETLEKLGLCKIVSYVPASQAREPEWLPIDSAPKDGREFLAVYGRQGNVVEVVKWNYLHKFWQSKGEPVTGFAANATAWHELPSPPHSDAIKETKR